MPPFQDNLWSFRCQFCFWKWKVVPFWRLKFSKYVSAYAGARFRMRSWWIQQRLAIPHSQRRLFHPLFWWWLWLPGDTEKPRFMEDFAQGCREQTTYPGSGFAKCLRKYRSIFTMKKALDLIHSSGKPAEYLLSEVKAEVHQVLQECITRPAFSVRSQESCTKEKTKQNKGTSCPMSSVDETVCKAAIGKDDERMLALLSRELGAAEGHYHRSCCRVYTKVQSSAGPHKKQEQSGEEVKYEEAERRAYDELNFFPAMTFYHWQTSYLGLSDL